MSAHRKGEKGEHFIRPNHLFPMSDQPGGDSSGGGQPAADVSMHAEANEEGKIEADEDDAEGEEAGKAPKLVKDPGLPSRKEVEEHEATHAQFRSWCRFCVRGRGLAWHHQGGAGDEDDKGMPEFVMDYCFPAQAEQDPLIVLVCKERKSGSTNSMLVPNKGHDEWVINMLVNFIESHGFDRIILKSDNEPAIVALQQAVKLMRVARAAPCDADRGTVLESSARGDSQSNGAAENAVREVEGMIRTWKLYIEEKLGQTLDNQHILLPWLIQHAGTLITRYKIGKDGKTAYQRLKGKKTSSRILPFGEKVLYMEPTGTKRRKNNLDSKHQYGIFAGVHGRTSEFRILTPGGAVKARTIHRLQLPQRWDAAFVSTVPKSIRR